MTDGEPAHNRVNDSLSCPSDTCPKHLLGRFSSRHYALKAAVGLIFHTNAQRCRVDLNLHFASLRPCVKTLKKVCLTNFVRVRHAAYATAGSRNCARRLASAPLPRPLPACPSNSAPLATWSRSVPVPDRFPPASPACTLL